MNTRPTLPNQPVMAAGVVVVLAITVGLKLLWPEEPDVTTDSPAGRHYEWSNSPAPLLILLPDEERQLGTLGSWDSPRDDDGGGSTGFMDGGWEPASDLEDVGRSETLDFWFGMPDWSWQAQLADPTDDPEAPICWRDAVVTMTGDQTFTLKPAGHPGTYRVNLFGDGPQGDRHTEFLWTTTVAGKADKRQCA